MIIYGSASSKLTKKQRAKRRLACEKQNAKYVCRDVPVVLARIEPVRREGSTAFRNIPSSTSTVADTFSHAPKQYTGDAIVGFATMHKSNIVPVFNEQHAVDLAHMRR